ncbi:MAG TPA: DNA repair protein RecO [Cytophagaceae bacterium]|jgi:DNA repair protein RecO (recombination protein O)|nr:DNA repair protein RecO [Cytophagaceae bacterium]
MLVKTRGIVLGSIKYKETSIIVNIYTEMLGLKSYIVNGVRDKKGKSAFFQPLTILDLIVYDQASKGLNRISEYVIHRPYKSSSFEPKKIAVLLFLSELFIKTLKEEHPDEELFSFLVKRLSLFDELEEEYEDFHVLFLLDYLTYLGVRPSAAEDIARDFGRLLDEDVTVLFDSLLNEEKGTGTFSLKISSSLRRRALEVMIDYYQIHFPSMGRIQSLAILKDVFS